MMRKISSVVVICFVFKWQNLLIIISNVDIKQGMTSLYCHAAKSKTV